MTASSRRLGVAKGVLEVPCDIDALNSQIAELFIGKGRRTAARTRKGHAIAADIARAMEAGIKEALAELDGPIAPRHLVDLMTMSSVEVGRMFKRALLDELWQARKRKS